MIRYPPLSTRFIIKIHYTLYYFYLFSLYEAHAIIMLYNNDSVITFAYYEFIVINNTLLTERIW